MKRAQPIRDVLNRRDVLQLGGLALSAAAFSPAPACAAPACTAPPDVALADVATAVAEAPDPALLAVLGNIVIAPTATPGAGEGESVAFVARALAAGLNDLPLDTLAVVRRALDGACGGHFMAASADRRLAAATALDRRAYGAARADGLAWQQLKGMLLTAYYTGETGASKELAYNLAPGRWDNDVLVTPATRTIGNDWAAISFR